MLCLVIVAKLRLGNSHFGGVFFFFTLHIFSLLKASQPEQPAGRRNEQVNRETVSRVFAPWKLTSSVVDKSRSTGGHNATRTRCRALLAPSTQLALCKAQLTARQDLVQLLSLPAWGHMHTGRQASRQADRAGELQGVFICPMVCLCCQCSIIIIMFYGSSVLRKKYF